MPLLHTLAAGLGIAGAGALSLGDCLKANICFAACNPILIFLFWQQNAQAQVLQFAIYEGLALAGIIRQVLRNHTHNPAGAIRQAGAV